MFLYLGMRIIFLTYNTDKSLKKIGEMYTVNLCRCPCCGSYHYELTGFTFRANYNYFYYTYM